MGRITRSLLIAGVMYVAYYLGEITGFIKGAKAVIDAADTKEEKEELELNIRTDRLESGVDIANCNLDILKSRTEDLEERIKILDSAFNYHIMDDNRHNMYGGN